jgi:oligoendopeptidase F
MFNTISKIRNFDDYVSNTAFADEIKVDLITTIYENVATFKSSYVKYRTVLDRLLKKQLSLNALEPWDRTVELSKKELVFNIEQTKQIILNAFKPLGVEYVENINKAFTER